MELIKKSYKLDNIFWSIIECRQYNQICNNPEYDNYSQPQKEILKTVLIPKVKTIITDLISSNREYECIKLEKLKSKYTKADKSITIDFVYNDARENIYVIAKIFENFNKELWNLLLPYKLFLSK